MTRDFRDGRNVVILRQHRIIPALRLKHRSGGCGTASALPKCSIRLQYYLRFWLSSCRTSLAVSALRIMRYCLKMVSNDGARGLDTMCAPYGKNYIAHDDIPPEVQAAFERLQAVYGTQTRAANPLYASK